MKNILITGGCGFIGSNFINYMVSKYNNLNFINIDALYYCASLDNIKVSNYNNYEFIKGNINDYNLLVYILKSKNIDTIINFAAQSHVDNSFLESLKYTEDNIKGTHTLLEAIKNTNIDIKFIHISTDEVYGETESIKKIENDKLSPTNPYAASKAAAEMIINSYINSFNMNIIITRSNNVYGPNQYPEKLIPKFIKLLLENQKCTIHGNGSSLRSFIHVDDLVLALECIMLKGIIGEIYNISADDNNELSVLDVAKLLIKLIKNTDNYNEYITFIEDRPFNDKRYYISNNKLLKLGWEPKITFIDGIKKLL
jgi:dTDP-glucose 4,6-dehydratase